MAATQVQDPTQRPLHPSLTRNIDALHERRQQEEAGAGLQDRIAGAVTACAGTMAFVYAHIAVYGTWIAANLGWVPGLPRFDRSFDLLGTAASVEAIFLSMFVLISQNRDACLADKRADLALHINLLTEDELTKLTHVVAAIAERLDVPLDDHDIHHVKRDIPPEAVLDEIDARQAR